MHDPIRFLPCQSSVIEILFQIRSKDDIQPSVVDTAGTQRIQPHQLQSLPEGRGFMIEQIIKICLHLKQFFHPCHIGICHRLFDQLNLFCDHFPEQFHRADARIRKVIPGSFFYFVHQTADTELPQFLIIQHHPAETGRCHERIFAVDEPSRCRIVQHILAVDGFDIMVLPEVIECHHSCLMFFVIKLSGKFAEFMKYTVVADTADGGDRAKTDRQKIQPAGNQILMFNTAEQCRKQHPQAVELAVCLVQGCTVLIGLCIRLHETELFFRCFFRRKPFGYIDVLRAFNIDMSHTRSSLTVSAYPSCTESQSFLFIFVHFCSHLN